MAVRFSDTPHIMDHAEIVRKDLAAVPLYQEIQHLVAVARDGQAPGELCYPICVALDSDNNQIYITEGGFDCARVSIFLESGEFLNTFSHKHMKYPWGIAIHRDNVYVTDIEKHLVFHFKVSANVRLVAKLGGRGSGILHFIEPRQLTVSPSGDVFVTDHGNHRIQILDGNLRYLRHISHHSMKEPRDIKLTPELVYILTDGSPCIHVFSQAGDKLRSLITRGHIRMKVIMPEFFCIDANENLLISDCGGDQIKIFSKVGTLLHTLGEHGHEAGMFDLPHGIALTNNLKMVVISQNNNYGLQIFSCL